MLCFSILLTTVYAKSSLGKKAYQITEAILAFGPRPSGSTSLKKVQDYVANNLERQGWFIKKDPFTANTPIGPINMLNVVAIDQGKSNRSLLLACHLETKRIDEAPNFIGANDSASACALLLAIAPQLQKIAVKHTLYLAFFDGEEAMVTWDDTDSLYGSRHMAEEFAKAGLLSNMTAMILVDMVGDRQLNIARDTNSNRRLQQRVARIAKEKGLEKHVFGYQASIEDDHIPFVKKGVPAIDLIDLRYGPPHENRVGAYYHTAEDTIDKISANSLDMIATIVLALVQELENDSIK